jgi:hypothetical protein
MSDDATRKFVYARGMPEGQGKFLIAAERRLLCARKKRGLASETIAKGRLNDVSVL